MFFWLCFRAYRFEFAFKWIKKLHLIFVFFYKIIKLYLAVNVFMIFVQYLDKLNYLTNILCLLTSKVVNNFVYIKICYKRLNLNLLI